MQRMAANTEHRFISKLTSCLESTLSNPFDGFIMLFLKVFLVGLGKAFT